MKSSCDGDDRFDLFDLSPIWWTLRANARPIATTHASINLQPSITPSDSSMHEEHPVDSSGTRPYHAQVFDTGWGGRPAAASYHAARRGCCDRGCIERLVVVDC